VNLARRRATTQCARHLHSPGRPRMEPPRLPWAWNPWSPDPWSCDRGGRPRWARNPWSRDRWPRVPWARRDSLPPPPRRFGELPERPGRSPPHALEVGGPHASRAGGGCARQLSTRSRLSISVIFDPQWSILMPRPARRPSSPDVERRFLTPHEIPARFQEFPRCDVDKCYLPR